MVIVHGYGEHSGRYERHANYFCDGGVALMGYDHPGHGRSEGRPGCVPSVDDLVGVLVEFLDAVTTRYPDIRPVVFGHSLGGTVAGLAALRVPERLAGLILSSPAIRLMEPLWLQRLGLLASRLFPLLPTKRLNRKLLSTDTAYVADAEADPLNYHGRVPVGTAAEMVISGRRLLAMGGGLNLPLLIVHGSADRMTSADASEELFRLASSRDKSLSFYNGMFHETLNEPLGHLVLARIGDFIEDRRG